MSQGRRWFAGGAQAYAWAAPGTALGEGRTGGTLAGQWITQTWAGIALLFFLPAGKSGRPLERRPKAEAAARTGQRPGPERRPSGAFYAETDAAKRQPGWAAALARRLPGALQYEGRLEGGRSYSLL